MIDFPHTNVPNVAPGDVAKRLPYFGTLDRCDVVKYLRTVAHSMWSFAATRKPYGAGHDTAYMLHKAADAIHTARAQTEAEETAHADTLCQLTEAQHALVLLADLHLTRGAEIPALDDATHAVIAVARNDQRQAREIDARAREVVASVIAEARAASGVGGGGA